MAAPDAPRPRRSRRWSVLLLVGLILGMSAASAVWTNALGAGDRFENLLTRIELALDPPPVRPTRQTVAVTPRPTVEPTEAPSPTPVETARPSDAPSRPPRTPSPTPSPTPAPVREPVDVAIVDQPERMFASEITEKWCAPAGTQMVLAILGRADTSEGFQRELVNRIDEWESYEDSHNGGWGPAAMAEALAAYGVPDYEIRAYEARADALRDSAAAIRQMNKPVILLAWRGAHTWVMTGYRADADPAVFPDATVSGAYILDPWFPRISSIWGPSDPPGTFQDVAEMERNFLPWRRPEGAYRDRDGKFIVLVPTVPLRPAG